MTDTVHTLEITLDDVDPRVWRRIEVPSSMTLGELAPVLVAAMGWEGYHLHAFDVDGTRYGMPDPDWASDQLDENEHRLGDVLTTVGSSMRWEYDFGDGWEHTVVVEAISPASDVSLYPRCVAGKRACPPEDCGGPWGYADILTALANPDDPDNAELLEWLGPGFDPEYFSVAETNDDLRSSSPAEGR